MEKIVVQDTKIVMDIDMEQECTFTLDDTHCAILDSYLYRTSMPNMDQGATPSNSRTHTNNNTYMSSLFTSRQLSNHMPMTMAMPRASSSIIHDWILDDMKGNDYSKAINTNGLDNSSRSGEFLNDPICESKPSNIYQLACTSEGLLELLYPTKVPELSFLNDLKMDQLPSWSDIFMPPYNNDDNNNPIPELNNPYFHQNQRFMVANLLGNLDDEAMVQNDLAFTHIHNNHSPKLNPTYHTNEPIKEAIFSHDIKNGGLVDHNSFQHVDNQSTVAATIDHPGGYSTQASFHYMNQPSEEIKKKTRPLESQPLTKGKLGERITTLQQLVSPYGKTDQASVLLEAMRCIKYLQDQVQALSSPYFKSPTIESKDEVKLDLRSKGLCLVPFSCNLQVENENLLDFFNGGPLK